MVTAGVGGEFHACYGGRNVLPLEIVSIIHYGQSRRGGLWRGQHVRAHVGVVCQVQVLVLELLVGAHPCEGDVVASRDVEVVRAPVVFGAVADAALCRCRFERQGVGGFALSYAALVVHPPEEQRVEILELAFPIALVGSAGVPDIVSSEGGADPDWVRVSGLIGGYIETQQLPAVSLAELIGFVVVAKVGLPVDDVAARCSDGVSSLL